MAAPKKDRSHWTVKKFTCLEEMRKYHVLEWQKLGAAARHKAAWELVTDYWVNVRQEPERLKFKKTITSFTRGKG